MEKHKCKLCLKSFANGRALGGHMRSHMLNLYVNPNPKPPPSPPLSPSLSSSSEEIKSEMSRNTTARQRSKRVRRPESSWFGDQQHLHEINHVKNPKQSPVSSISDSSPEEVVAYCLMMLSRDTWTHEQENDDELEPEPESELELELELETESEGEVVKALGGHIASHKKIKLNNQFQYNKYHPKGNVLEDKIYECHVCFKVFASGQALGGHKRSHVSSKQVVKESINMFDLNLPAPSDDDDDDDD
ncbi:putative transcription factor C2H2 family [Helianthus annuus]|nr:putative transcription factor C2H2 family [Helianthus annuus]